MKKIIVLFAICAVTLSVSAQTNDDVYYTSDMPTDTSVHKTAGQVIKDLHPQVFVQSNGYSTTAGVSIGNGNWNLTVSGSTSPYGNSVGASSGVGCNQYSTNQYPKPNGGNNNYYSQQQPHSYGCQGCGVTNSAYVVGPCH